MAIPELEEEMEGLEVDEESGDEREQAERARKDKRDAKASSQAEKVCSTIRLNHFIIKLQTFLQYRPF